MDFDMTEKEEKNSCEFVSRQIAFLKAKQSMKPTQKKQPEQVEKQIRMKGWDT